MDVSVFSVHDQLVAMGQIGLAAVLGAAVGAERDRAGKSAGIRTHMLVAASSALAVALGALIVAHNKSGDPTRMAHAVFTGIGFIGGGMIWKSKHDAGPQGITSAATIMMVAGIGAACGLGAPILAVGVCAMGLLTLTGMYHLEVSLHARSQRRAERATTARPSRSGDDEDAIPMDQSEP